MTDTVRLRAAVAEPPTAERRSTRRAVMTKLPPKFRGDRPIQTVGRRKQAIVRVRLIPGTGKITCNGRDARGYFPSKVRSSPCASRS